MISRCHTGEERAELERKFPVAHAWTLLLQKQLRREAVPAKCPDEMKREQEYPGF
jgi:hypothetical protein